MARHKTPRTRRRALASRDQIPDFQMRRSPPRLNPRSPNSLNFLAGDAGRAARGWARLAQVGCVLVVSAEPPLDLEANRAVTHRSILRSMMTHAPAASWNHSRLRHSSCTLAWKLPIKQLRHQRLGVPPRFCVDHNRFEYLPQRSATDERRLAPGYNTYLPLHTAKTANCQAVAWRKLYAFGVLVCVLIDRSPATLSIKTSRGWCSAPVSDVPMLASRKQTCEWLARQNSS